MDSASINLLRGVCQIPAYVAHDKGFFEEQGVQVRLEIAPTAWTVPDRLLRGEVQFAVIPWTRVAVANTKSEPLVLVCGSGFEEAAIVVRTGVAIDQVRTVAVPLRGGMKDLTAMGLMRSLGWSGVESIRQPSGDGAILALVGQGVDAASMVEPYATSMEQLGIGTVVRRTGDLWPGAPGCSLTTTRTIVERHPDLVLRVVRAFVRGAEFVDRQLDESAEIAARYIGFSARFIRQALNANRPDIHALKNDAPMKAILTLMQEMGYIDQQPRQFSDLAFLEQVIAGCQT